MSEKLLDSISKCSQKSKSNIADFFKGLLQKKQEVEEKITKISELSEIFHKYTASFSLTKAREVSKDERNLKFLTGHQFNYGQITFETIEIIFKKIAILRKPTEEQIFYDLGSGTGKVVFAASMCYPFKRCYGIEYLKSLCDFSESLREMVVKNNHQIESDLSQIENSIMTIPPIEFINADFKEDFQIDWSDGSIIFVSSTCYSRQVMSEIEKLCVKLKKGTIIVTLTRKLEDFSSLKLVTSFQGSTSWGVSTIFIHEKKA